MVSTLNLYVGGQLQLYILPYFQLPQSKVLPPSTKAASYYSGKKY
ncbi:MULTISPECIES: hypothetical protein [unclassified Nostoc]|nr:hypothetical protein [Nostoc sp. JL34]